MKHNFKIAVVNSNSFGKYFPEHLQWLSAIGKIRRIIVDRDIEAEGLAKKLNGFQIIIASVSPTFTSEFFKLNNDCILLARHGIGFNNVDVLAATKAGVLVTKVSGIIEQEAMAEHAVALLLSVMRKINNAYLAVKQNKWSNRADFVGMEIRNKTIGLIGIGNIGKRVAHILKFGFGAKIIAYDPFLSNMEIKKRHAVPVSLNHLIKNSDVISLHSSLNKTSFNILGKKEFSLMKQNVVIINTARGELINEKSLIKNLKNKKIFGAGFDVVEGEPINSKHPLLKFDNVIVVPHIGAYTMESLKGMGDKIINDVENVFIKKIAPLELVNPNVLKTITKIRLK